ncbi:energy transducer TonB [Granulicella sp. WH15]|uniref:energy transducer TonB family protein n=1 Tax=Granulicella sp. WH15 TaxID=2602070 RepID=UPI001366C3B7|nr:TonB family protein [Granulicella sp. WH15]QHN03560.1 energy transducer TonB [Granulicella sp. WH15]
MPTELLPIRRPIDTGERTPIGLGGAILLHVLIVGLVLGWSLADFTRHKGWGQADMQAGAIQATMVNSLPLPPKQLTKDNAVLTSEKPSPAPEPPPKAKAEPPPKPNEVLIPTKAPPPKPVKTAEKPTPAPPKHPQPVVPQPTKATTGETAGVRIPQAVTQLKNGTASMTVEDKAFGDRYAYYVRIVNQKVAAQWLTAEADSRASNGKRVTIIFDIDHDGVPSNARVGTRSGSPTLDMSALRAVQRVDGFGPLPQGNHITVEYSFDYKQP